uniref:Uncharacterized protein n=1 Tax=Ananas comosus var. bracteatus TaxID=296719 RepID=A0A6V7PAP6_ANACO|nr:unnamed protein product [Ananas comosus var. bracteatus]
MPRRSSGAHQAPPSAPVQGGGSIVGRIGGSASSNFPHSRLQLLVALPPRTAPAPPFCSSSPFTPFAPPSRVSFRFPHADTMPRRSFGGRSAPRAAPRAAPVRNPPQPAHQAPPPAPVQGGGSILGGIGSTIDQGVASAKGSAMAHRAADAAMGPRTTRHETVVTEASAAAATLMGNAVGSDARGLPSKVFQNCGNNFGSHIGQCKFHLG